MEPRVVDNPEELRYELWLGDRLAGQINYVREDGKVVLVHTEVDPSLAGQGLGNALVQGALDDLRERSVEYVPLCPFVTAYLRRHPQDR
ncbi:MAG TPA: GNAT family N-acetyltransferase [Gaiellaceae bacterium]|nr:GNAT family N-acetyltransferase [Gaiellaceae bacterium]